MGRSLALIGLSCALAVLAEDPVVTQSMVFPADWQGGRFCMVAGLPMTMVFQFAGAGRRLADHPPRLVVDMPEGFCLHQVTPRHVHLEAMPMHRERTTVQGQRIDRYVVDYPRSEVMNLTPDYGWSPGHYLYVEASKEAVGRKRSMKLSLIYRGKVARRHEIKLEVLPAFAPFPRRLERFKIGIHRLCAQGIGDFQLYRRYADFWTDRGHRPFVQISWPEYHMKPDTLRYLGDHFDVYAGFFACRDSTFQAPGTDFKDLGFLVGGRVVRPGVPNMLDANGKKVARAICPQYLLKDPDGLFFGEYLRRSVRKSLDAVGGRAVGVWFDFEPFVEYGTCDECLGAFKEFAKLSGIPRREDIVDGRPLNRKWREFKLVQHREILGRVVDAFRHGFPDLKISLCTSPPASREEILNNWSCVDSREVVPLADSFSTMNYNVGLEYYDSIREQKRTLRRTRNYSWIDPAEESKRFFCRYAPETVLQNIVATISQGADGFVVYPLDLLDGRMFQALDQGFRAIALCENIYHGQVCDRDLKWQAINVSRIRLRNENGKSIEHEIPDFAKTIRAHLHGRDGEYAVSLLNYSDENPAFLKLSMPEFKGGQRIYVENLLQDCFFQDVDAQAVRDGFLVELPVNGSMVVRIGRSLAMTGDKVVTQQETSRRLAEWRENHGGGQAGLPGRISGGQAQWCLYDHRIVLRMQNGGQWVLIDPAQDAGIISWKNRNGTRTPVGGSGKMLGVAEFYSQAQRKNLLYSLVSAEEAEDRVCSVWRHVVAPDSGFGEENPLAGLQIEKRISLCRGDDVNGRVVIEHAFLNPDHQKKSFGFRLRNIPCSADRNDPMLVLTTGGRKMHAGTWLRKGVTIPWSYAANAGIAPEDLSTVLYDRWYCYGFKLPDAVGLYSWSGQRITTVEPLYPAFTLEKGQRRSFSMEVEFKQDDYARILK